MGKIKVNKEVFEALEEAKFFLGSENYKNWILQGYHKGSLSHDQFDGLERNLWKYEIHEVAEILFNGYELKETPEEILLKKFRQYENDWGWHRDNEIECMWRAKQIKETLGILGIKIKGING